jgi:hypothetical protein
MFILLLRYFQVMRSKRIRRAEAVAAAAKAIVPITTK